MADAVPPFQDTTDPAEFIKRVKELNDPEQIVTLNPRQADYLANAMGLSLPDTDTPKCNKSYGLKDTERYIFQAISKLADGNYSFYFHPSASSSVSYKSDAKRCATLPDEVDSFLKSGKQFSFADGSNDYYQRAIVTKFLLAFSPRNFWNCSESNKEHILDYSVNSISPDGSVYDINFVAKIERENKNVSPTKTTYFYDRSIEPIIECAKKATTQILDKTWKDKKPSQKLSYSEYNHLLSLLGYDTTTTIYRGDDSFIVDKNTGNVLFMRLDVYGGVGKDEKKPTYYDPEALKPYLDSSPELKKKLGINALGDTTIFEPTPDPTHTTRVIIEPKAIEAEAEATPTCPHPDMVSFTISGKENTKKMITLLNECGRFSYDRDEGGWTYSDEVKGKKNGLFSLEIAPRAFVATVPKPDETDPPDTLDIFLDKEMAKRAQKKKIIGQGEEKGIVDRMFGSMEGIRDRIDSTSGSIDGAKKRLASIRSGASESIDDAKRKARELKDRAQNRIHTARENTSARIDRIKQRMPWNQPEEQEETSHGKLGAGLAAAAGLVSTGMKSGSAKTWVGSIVTLGLGLDGLRRVFSNKTKTDEAGQQVYDWENLIVGFGELGAAAISGLATFKGLGAARR